jgi:hypothetical protein
MELLVADPLIIWDSIMVDPKTKAFKIYDGWKAHDARFWQEVRRCVL